MKKWIDGEGMSPATPPLPNGSNAFGPDCFFIFYQTMTERGFLTRLRIDSEFTRTIHEKSGRWMTLFLAAQTF